MEEVGCLGLAGVLPGWFTLSHCRRCSSVWLQTRGSGSSHATPCRPNTTGARACCGTTNLISGSTSTLGSAHVFVDNIYPCAPSRLRSWETRELGRRASVARCAPSIACLSAEAHHRHKVCLWRILGRLQYRSTIGTDFITRTLPHHSKPDESVTLQIWVRRHHHPIRLHSLSHASLTRP
jgi:hypothetical protein